MRDTDFILCNAHKISCHTSQLVGLGRPKVYALGLISEHEINSSNIPWGTMSSSEYSPAFLAEDRRQRAIVGMVVVTMLSFIVVVVRLMLGGG